MRSPADMDIIQIDISTKCHLKCSNCTRLIPHQPSRDDLSLEAFERAVKSMDGWDGPNKVIGIIAGEPTLHHDFERISRRFAELWGGPTTGNGRAPIHDFNMFATQRLFDRSTGRGLWTSLGAGFYRHYETIMDVYGHWNTNTHESGGHHQALLISRKDYIAASGISDEQWERNRDDCWVQKLWSASMNDKGAYFCEVAASIDRLYFGGAHAWPIEHGWWQRKPEDFKHQLELCNYCGLAQPGPSQLDILERDIISDENLHKLAEAGSPAVKKGKFEQFDPELHTQKRTVDQRDNYVGDGRRVGIGNNSTKPRKLSGVVVSVGFGSALAETLPRNAAHFDELVVVTTSDDELTQALARQNNAKLVISDRCYDDDDAFNKGKLVNDGFAALTDPDWVILFDADVVLNANTRHFITHNSFNPGCLYYTARRDRGETGANQMQPSGYFQLFSPQATSIREHLSPLLSESFCSAGSVDSWFQQQWAPDRVIAVPELEVEHVASQTLGQNWNGQKPIAGKWTQLGLLTPQGFGTFMQMSQLPDVIKLTDTKYGDSIVIETKDFDQHVKLSPAGLQFDGKDIGHCHIHVAFRA
ncbi:MAG TPA: hypothetical protein VM661_10345 [Candidatus Sulfotelmatobacter sp.]|jgi:hypothetical protein|nr:hypothetical protein [Candidatus Sulfotelmatobacter sp.]